jgi:tight adherence protein B
MLPFPISLALGGDMVVMALLGFGPLLMLYGLWQLVSDLRGGAKKKIASRLRGQTATKSTDLAAKVATIEDIRRHTKQGGGALGALLGDMQFTKRLQETLEQANLPWSASGVLVNLSVAAAAVLAIFIFFGMPIWSAAGAAICIFVLPLFYFHWCRKRRVKKFVNQLPDVFDLLGQALRAGHSLASGMQLVASEMPDPAGTEFSRVFHEHNLGLKVEESLANLADRMDVLDVRFFVTAVLIQRQTGGDLAEVLDKISGVIRERIKLHGTILALTAEGRLSGYVLLALPVVVFVALLQINYSYADILMSDPTGQMMLTTAIVMMAMGWMMIKKIVNIKV